MKLKSTLVLRHSAWVFLISFLLFFLGRTLPCHILQRDIWTGYEYQGLDSVMPLVETSIGASVLLLSVVCGLLARPMGKGYWRTVGFTLLAVAGMFLTAA